MPGTAVDQRGLSVSCSRLSWERSWGCCWPCCPQSRRRPHSARRFPEGRTGAIPLLVAGERPRASGIPILAWGQGKGLPDVQKSPPESSPAGFLSFFAAMALSRGAACPPVPRGERRRREEPLFLSAILQAAAEREDGGRAGETCSRFLSPPALSAFRAAGRPWKPRCRAGGADRPRWRPAWPPDCRRSPRAGVPWPGRCRAGA